MGLVCVSNSVTSSAPIQSTSELAATSVLSHLTHLLQFKLGYISTTNVAVMHLKYYELVYVRQTYIMQFMLTSEESV